MDTSPNYIYPSMGLSPLKSDQDFCIAAKSLFSPNYNGYPQDCLNFDIPLGKDELDVDSLFDDANLRDDQPIDYLSNFLPNSSPLNSFLSGSSNFPIEPFFDSFEEGGPLKHELDEYLNAVNDEYPTTEIEPAFCLQSFEDPSPIANNFNLEPVLQGGSSGITIKLKKFKSKKKKARQHESVSPTDCQEVPDARMTLKDAMNMENADVILDRLFEQDSDSDSYEYSASSSPFTSSYSTPVSSPGSSSDILEADDEPKRRGRARGTQYERYNKKKEQNKQAAIRYRQKKRQAEDDLLRTMESAEKKKKDLTKTLKGLKREVNLMKKLMREAFIIKGLVSADAFKK